MRRREFIALSGAAIAWPHLARAQRPGRIARVGVLMGIGNDVEGQSRFAAFKQGMRDLKWTEGADIGFDVRWAGGDAALVKTYVAELIGLKPDVIFGINSPVMRALKDATLTIPIVFAGLADPIGDGIVASLSRPGGNITGFSSYDAPMAGKWLQLLKEISPGIQRVAVMYNPDTAPHSLFWPTLEAIAPVLGVSLIRATVRDIAAFETAISRAAATSRAGLMLLPDSFTSTHRKLIYALAEQHRLPAVWPIPFHAVGGGLIAYGPDFVDLCQRAATYVDRILRGESTPSDLPVQQPTKFELKINLKTAKAIGVEVPLTLLATANAVIE